MFKFKLMYLFVTKNHNPTKLYLQLLQLKHTTTSKNYFTFKIRCPISVQSRVSCVSNDFPICFAVCSYSAFARGLCLYLLCFTDFVLFLQALILLVIKSRRKQHIENRAFRHVVRVPDRGALACWHRFCNTKPSPERFELI